MKSVLLGVTLAAFSLTSAYAGCFNGHQKMAMSVKAKSAETAQSTSEKRPNLNLLQFASLKDGWLVKYL